MRKPTAPWAIVMTIAQALFGGCGGTQSTASPAVAPGEPMAAGPGPLVIEPGMVDEFSERVDPGRVPHESAELPSRGPLGAPVTIHLFSDFECPFCAHAVPVLRELEAEFGGSVRTVWHNFPLPGHPHAELAAVAGVVVYRARGGAAFWRFHDAVFAAARGGLDDAAIERIAGREGVDPKSIRAALPSGADGRIATDIAAGDAAGVKGTPAFFVNDRTVTGVLPYPAFRALILVALEEAKRR